MSVREHVIVLSRPEAFRLSSPLRGQRWIALLGLAIGCLGEPGHDAGRARRIYLGALREDVIRGAGEAHRWPFSGREARWVFDGRSGQRITVTAASYELDPCLVLLDPAGRRFAENDDADWFANAHVQTTLPTTGRYVIIVRGADADQHGAYRLHAEAGFQQPAVDERSVLDTYRDGVKWAESEGNARALCRLDLAMASYLRVRGEWERSELYCSKGEAIAKQSGYVYGECGAALEHARLSSRLMRYDVALRELQRAADLSLSLRSGNDIRVAVATHLGDLYTYLGRRELADTYYRNALAAVGTSEKPSLRCALEIPLSERALVDDPGVCLRFARNAFDLSQSASPLVRLNAAYALASACLRSGRLEESARLADAAHREARDLGVRDSEVSFLILQSIISHGRKDVEGMVTWARRAAGAISAQDPDPGPRGMALQLEADGETLRANFQAALGLCLSALGGSEAAWERTELLDLREWYLSQSKAMCSQAMRLLVALNSRGTAGGSYAAQAFDLAERSRCRSLLVEMEAGNHAVRDCPPERPADDQRALLHGISSVGYQRTLLDAGMNASPVALERFDNQRADLVGLRMQLEGQATSKDSVSRADARQPLSAAEVQKGFLARHPNTAILFYQLGRLDSFLIVLTEDRASLYKLPDWMKIARSVADWRNEIRNQAEAGTGGEGERVRRYGEVAYALWRMLVEPAKPAIGGRELLIVSDRALHDVAFEALVCVPPGEAVRFGDLRYLGEKHAMSYAPSVTTVDQIEGHHSRSPAGNKMLLLGDPVFNDQDPRARGASAPVHASMAARNGALFRSGLQRLRATRDEVLTIARLGRESRWTPDVWLDYQASERNLKRAPLESYRDIHLATHASADLVEGQSSGVVLSLDTDGAGEDGLLTAAEVAELRLDADLVVLSGCVTGGGQATEAEGVIGLSREFLIAGSARVCASLWNVEDRCTTRLMTAFYEEMLANALPAPRALQQAKLALIRSDAAPVAWASFVLVGPPSGRLDR